MKALRCWLIGFIWIPVLALAGWWAGFMPFPTRPGDVGLTGFTYEGLGGDGSNYRLLISVAKAKEAGKAAPFAGAAPGKENELIDGSKGRLC